MKEPRIYRSVWNVVVLSGEPVGKLGFGEVAYLIDEGDCLGSYNLAEEQEIKGAEAVVRACEEVGDDGSFFALPADGAG